MSTNEASVPSREGRLSEVAELAPCPRPIAWTAVGAGGVVAMAALLADALAPTGASGFGVKQALVVLAAGTVVAAGASHLLSARWRPVAEWAVLGAAVGTTLLAAELGAKTGLPAVGVRQLVVGLAMLGALLVGPNPRLARAWQGGLWSAARAEGTFPPGLLLLAQVALLLTAVWQFELETAAFAGRVMPLAVYGFVVHACLPMRLRLPFFACLSVAAVVGVIGASDGTWLLAVGMALIGVCHLPLPMAARVGILLAVAGGLTAQRARWVPSPWTTAVWPVLGSMFMFRLIVYVKALHHGRERPALWSTLGYFFLLPNIVFPLFPVVDYETFRRTYYEGDRYRIYQTGVDWMARGAVHLLLYRAINYHLAIAPADIASAADLGRYLIANFLLYLRVSGQFHLATGILHLYGFHLPETHNRYFLASSFTEFWRRINIYWKDFMLGLVYYPAYFWCRRWGTLAGMLLATAAVFTATWFFHAYQWFWLRGTFLIAGPDIAFWTLLAVLVMVNTVIEATRGRIRRLKPRPAGWRSRASLTVRTAATFSTICVLWSLWTSESLAEWVALWDVPLATADQDPTAWLVLALGAGLVGSSWFLVSARPGARSATPIHRSAVLTTVALLAIVLAGRPEAYERVGGRVAEMARSVTTARLSARDAALLQRGYYEDLLGVDRFNNELWQVYALRPTEATRLTASPVVRPTHDFLEQTLVPRATEVSGDVVTLRINRWGMRDRDYEPQAAPGTARVAFLGASQVMGAGVADEETFENLLEVRLNRANDKGRFARFESLNFGVTDYSPPQLLLALGHTVVGFKPSVLFYVAHQFDAAVSMLHLVDRSQAGIRPPFPHLDDLLTRAGVSSNTSTNTGLRRLKPYGPDIVAWTYREIVSRCRQAGILPVWLFVPTPELNVSAADVAVLRRAAAAAGFVVIDLSDVFEGHDIPSLWVASWDHHPNAKGHAVIADRVYRALQERHDVIALGLSPSHTSAAFPPASE